MKIGVADTTFARVDMAHAALEVLQKESGVEIVRYTVPGFKDLAVACLKLFQEDNCDMCMAFGMAGGADIDIQCAHEASMAIQQAQLMAGKHIIEVFVFTNESDDPQELKKIALNRAAKHAQNTIDLLKGKTTLTPFAGKGRRQGKEDEGGIQ